MKIRARVGSRAAHRLRIMERNALRQMKMTKKYYFSRKENAAIYADDEEMARLHLAQIYGDSEDFILDDGDGRHRTITGEYKVVGR